MPKKADAATAERLKDLADAEVAAAKQRLTTRTVAAARFATAAARLRAARQAWEATQGEAATDKAAAVEQLLATGMNPAKSPSCSASTPKSCGRYEPRARPAPPENPTMQPPIPAPSPRPPSTTAIPRTKPPDRAARPTGTLAVCSCHVVGRPVTDDPVGGRSPGGRLPEQSPTIDEVLVGFGSASSRA
jgi:hypothetical protein